MDFGLFFQLGFAVEVGLRDVWFIFDGLKDDFFVVVAFAAIEQDVAFAFLFEELYRMTLIIFLQCLFLYILRYWMPFLYFKFLQDFFGRDAPHLHICAFELAPGCFILLIFLDLLKLHHLPSGACAVVDSRD